MAFKELLNISLPERDLYQMVSEKLQREYTLHQNAWYFIKLEKDKNKLGHSYISWVKEFDDPDKMMDFHYDTVNLRACILTKFESGKHQILCHGFWVFNIYTITPIQISAGREGILAGRTEYGKMIDRELLESAFGEITSELKSAKRQKSV